MGQVYAVSDIHGFADDLRRELTEAGLIDGDDWVGQDAQLWVLGDLTDRGPDGIGVVRLLRGLQAQAPGQVHVLMGNHEAISLGRRLFPESRFGTVWVMNGGRQRDQDGLTDDDIEWLRSMPVIGASGDFLLMHSDTVQYLTWGDSVDVINATVADLLSGDDFDDHWSVFATLSGRYDFAGDDGTLVAEELLQRLGGRCIVHGHSIIGSLVGKPSWQTTGPIRYADGRVVAIDGGRYDDGPLLVVRLA